MKDKNGKGGVKGWRKGGAAAVDCWQTEQTKKGQRGFRQREDHSRWRPLPTRPPSIHFTHTYTHTAGAKPVRRGANKTLIIRSSSLPFLFCLALFLSHLLSVPINNLSFFAPPHSVHNQITVSDWRRCRVRILLAQLQPTHKNLNRITKWGSHIL